MSDQTKPTTDEWTPKRVEKLLGFNAILGCERIADAHNASLDELRIANNAALEQLREQRDEAIRLLESEQGKLPCMKAETDGISISHGGATPAQNALDEAHSEGVAVGLASANSIAAAQQPLVDALRIIKDAKPLMSKPLYDCIEAALAKVKEGK